MGVNLISKLLGAGQTPVLRSAGSVHQAATKNYATNPNLISRLDAYDIQYGCPKEVKSDILGQKYCGLA
jgi:hypothetical protein